MTLAHDVSVQNHRLQATRTSRAPEPARVCRAWHVACGVGVPAPGIGEAEGKRKGNCVTAKWGGKEAQRESTGRRTGTGYEVWYTWDELARDSEILHLRMGCAL